MTRYVAFLRAMNVGGRRITNRELCARFEDLGFSAVTAVLASGNVVFDARERGAQALTERIEQGLSESLGYAVPTFLRDAREVRAIVARDPFPRRAVERSTGKLQVVLLSRKPASGARRAALDLPTEADRLALHGRELYWLPEGKLMDSELGVSAFERVLGPVTVRTVNTLARIAAKHLGDD